MANYKVKPSEKQKKAIELLPANGGNVSKSMREAGYSEAMAKNPQKLTQSQAFQQIMQEAGVTDEKLVSVLKDGLEATKVIVMGTKSDESFVDIQPDHPTRHKFLETSLKIKGIGKDSDGGTTVNLNFNNIAKQDKDNFGI